MRSYTQTPQMLTEIIRTRRSIFADDYINKSIPKTIIEEVLTNGTWAPTYKMTEPWRFIVLQGVQLEKFGQFMADFYKNKEEGNGLSQKRYDRLINYPSKAGCIVALILPRNFKVQISEWEEIAALSCAVQNMWLSCTAHGIGAYWDTCEACLEYGHQLELESHERCLGFFYMGYYDISHYSAKKRRTSLDQKVSWLQ